MRRGRGDRGQILPIMTLVLIALLGIGAFAIDVGYAYYAKRQLQSATDAAALAGAQDLPTATTAKATAATYAAREHPCEPLDRHLHLHDDLHDHGDPRPAATRTNPNASR